MILANTFFKTDSATGGGEGKGSAAGAGREQRTYLLRELRDHDLWKLPRWECIWTLVFCNVARQTREPFPGLKKL